MSGQDIRGIDRYVYSSGTESYRAIVTKGRRQFRKIFSKLDEAKRYKGITEESLRQTGLPLTNRSLKKTTVSSVVDLYLNGGQYNGKTIVGGLNVKGKPLGDAEIIYCNKLKKWCDANRDPSFTEFEDIMTMLIILRLPNGRGTAGE